MISSNKIKTNTINFRVKMILHAYMNYIFFGKNNTTCRNGLHQIISNLLSPYTSKIEFSEVFNDYSDFDLGEPYESQHTMQPFGAFLD